MARGKNNYLNNRDLLAEIHKSKKTYCYFIDVEFSDYDIILQNIEEINDITISQAKQNKADRYNKEIKDKNLDKDYYSPEQFIKTDLVFRVMENSHVPEEVLKNRKAKNANPNERIIKLNFKPFKHYIISDEDELKEVGRSHWKDGLENGYFSVDHGKITDKLADMFVKLVERYSQKGNWRGYTWLEDMRGQALMQLVETALKFDEAKSQNAFAYYTCIVTNSFRGMLNTEDKVSNIKNKVMMESGYSPSYDYQLKHEMGNGGFGDDG